MGNDNLETINKILDDVLDDSGLLKTLEELKTFLVAGVEYTGGFVINEKDDSYIFVELSVEKTKI
jgi:hypothetical protein